MSENKDNVASIQLLRGVAALLVVFMHEQFFFALYAPQVGAPLPAMSSWHHFKTFGGMGVDLFFVISGFIMAYLVARNPHQSLGEFFWRRITRIVPLYWLSTCFWLWWNPHHSVDYIVRSFLFLPVKGVFPLTGVGWTLNMEMFFYVVFGVVVVKLRRSIWWIAALFLALGVVARLSDNYALDFYGDPLVWCFFAGLLIHRVYQTPRIQRWAPAFLALGVGSLTHACLDFAPSAAWAPDTIVWWGIPCALLTLGCVSLESAGELRRIWNLRLMQALGAASYSIYLVHPIGFANLNFYFLHYTAAVHRLGSDGAIVLLVAMAAVAGYLVHRLIELPAIEVLRSGRRFLKTVSG